MAQPMRAYRRRLTLLGRILRRLLRRSIGRFDPNRRLTARDVKNVADELWPQFVRVRRQMQAAALDLHEEVTGFRPEVREILYRKSWLENNIRKYLQEPWNADIAAGIRAQVDSARNSIEAAVIQSAESAARRTTLRAVEADVASDETPTNTPEYTIGHARMIQGEYTCAWCIMLASRGPVYSRDEYDAWQRDKKAYMDDFHFKCDCILVPVVKSKAKDWEGYKDYRAFEEAWKRITRGLSGVNAVNAWRRHFREAARKGVDPLTMPVNPALKNQVRARAA